MLLTLVCSAFTIISFYMQQYHDTAVLDDLEEDAEASPTGYSIASTLFSHSAAAFYTGTFGMWNLYVLLLLSMYAPSQKYYSQASQLQDEQEDLMDPQCSSTEDTPMVAFLKAATD